jgi:phenylalanyl-tRNA synthetase beta chain
MKFSSFWLKQYLPFLFKKQKTKKIVNALNRIGFEVSNYKYLKILNLNKKFYVGKIYKKKFSFYYKNYKIKEYKIITKNNSKIIKVFSKENLDLNRKCSVFLSNNELFLFKCSNLEKFPKILFRNKTKSNKKYQLYPEFYPRNKELIIDIEIPYNRSDCLSHIGIARELGIYFKQQLLNNPKILNSKKKINRLYKRDIKNDLISINFNQNLFKNYFFSQITDVVLTKTPNFIKKMLINLDIEIGNNIVENLIKLLFFKTGCLIHAFDKDKIKNQIIKIEKLEKETKIKINKKVTKLKKGNIVITNMKNVISCLGVFNNDLFKITRKTKNIFIGYFDFNSKNFEKIRNLSKNDNKFLNKITNLFRHNIDSSHIISSIKEFFVLINSVLQGNSNRNIFSLKKIVSNKEKYIDLNIKKIQKFLGFSIEKNDIKKLLKKRGFSIIKNKNDFHQKFNNKLKIKIPKSRLDLINNYYGYIEELIKSYGVENIPINSSLSSQLINNPRNYFDEFNDKISIFLSNNNFNEIISNSFVSSENINLFFGNKIKNFLKIENPLSQNNIFLRPSLIIGLLKVLKYNLDRRNECTNFFEIGKIFLKKERNFERMSLSTISLVEENNFYGIEKQKDIYLSYVFSKVRNIIISAIKRFSNSFEINLKNFMVLKRNSLIWEKMLSIETVPNFNLNNNTSQDKILINNLKIGFLNSNLIKKFRLKLNKKIICSELIFSPLENNKLIERNNISYIKKFKKFSLFPDVSKDISIIVPIKKLVINIHCELENFSKEILKPVRNKINLKNIFIFDIFFFKENIKYKKSISFRFIFSGFDETLRNKTINKYFDKIKNRVKKKYYIRDL